MQTPAPSKKGYLYPRTCSGIQLPGNGIPLPGNGIPLPGNGIPLPGNLIPLGEAVLLEHGAQDLDVAVDVNRLVKHQLV